MAIGELIFTRMIAALGLSMQASPSFASYAQELSGRTPEDVQKKAIQNSSHIQAMQFKAMG
jgi:hypothetical protein